jgi:cold shock protein
MARVVRRRETSARYSRARRLITVASLRTAVLAPDNGCHFGQSAWVGWSRIRSWENPRVEHTRHGPVIGVVAVWHSDEGWGAIRSSDVIGEIWAHFSNIKGPGYRALVDGEHVTLTYESPGQDGYPHRAISIAKDGDT